MRLAGVCLRHPFSSSRANLASETSIRSTIYSICHRKHVDSHLVKTGFCPQIYSLNHVIDCLVKEKDLARASKLFEQMTQKNVISWNTLISGYVSSRDVCEARRLFDRATDRNLITWTVMMAGHAQSGETAEAFGLFSELRRSDLRPDRVILTTLLSACNVGGQANSVRQVHSLVVKFGYDSTLLVANTLLDSYCKSGLLSCARQLLDQMPRRDCVTFNAMIAGYTKNGIAEEPLLLFLELQKAGLRPTEFTFTGVIAACTAIDDIDLGAQIHGCVVKINYGWNIFVGNAMLDMYAKSDRAGDARLLFDEMPQRDCVSYNILITSYAWDGQWEESLILFGQLQFAGLDPKQYPFATILSMLANSTALDVGKQVHAQAIITSAESEISVCNALIDLYAKCGNLEIAESLFRGRQDLNTVSWTSLISGCIQQFSYAKSMQFFSEMRMLGMSPDQATFSSILSACASLVLLDLGRQVHSTMLKSGFMSNVFTGSALVDMYAKCGSIEYSKLAFNEMPNRNIVSWNAMISAYAQNGCGKAALGLFDEMLELGIYPNSVTLLSLLSACSHAGMADEGYEIFNSMSKTYGILPRREHYACMVDVLGRVGKLDDAERLITKMPFEPDEIMLSSILNSCKIHKNPELAQRTADRLFHIGPSDASPYVAMSNIYAAAGRWEDVANVKKSMKGRGLIKEPAYSWVVIKHKSYFFSSNDDLFPQMEEVKAALDKLHKKMIRAGFKPDTSCVLHRIKEEAKIEALRYHSEKLAVAFALINTPPGSPITVIKNLRACADCHTAIKVISTIVGREITVRDSSRFHHFRDGVCSCRDFW
ncbi:unnamed protein product [Victoria cruziana]